MFYRSSQLRDGLESPGGTWTLNFQRVLELLKITGTLEVGLNAVCILRGSGSMAIRSERVRLKGDVFGCQDDKG